MENKSEEIFQIIKNALNQINIKGRNLGTKENVSFDLLSKKFTHPELASVLKKIEEFYLQIYSLSYSDEYAYSLPTVGGKVEIKPGTYFHLTKPNYEQIKNIGMAGVIASEWFGIVESEQEGVFCAFLNTVRSDEKKTNMSNTLFMQNRNSYLGIRGSNCALFFDANNPLIQRLARLDFFEYAHIKRLNPELLDKKYTKEEIEVLDLIYRFSRGRDFHDKVDDILGRDLWLAIPGGIPPMLVSGVCINMSKKEFIDLQDKIEEIRICFPNAVIFDENQNVLAYPKKNESQKTIR